MQTPGNAAPATGGRVFVFDRMEWAGAFGDLGTLVPFVVAYVAVAGVAPAGMLACFGAALVACAFLYRTPFPVQPMKAIGATAAAQAAQATAITAGMVHAATAITGGIWLLLAVTGAAERVARWVPRTILVGIVLGLGIALMVEGVRRMAGEWWIAVPALLAALWLLESRRVPAMLLLLALGFGAGIAASPQGLREVAAAGAGFELPAFVLADVSGSEWLAALVFLALPQVPLTLGNALIAVREENNRLFPDRPVTERKVALTTAAMNLGGSLLGGVPMCHGAGGLAGHVRFGARTGGATLILGVLLLAAGLLAPRAVTAALGLLAPGVLGVMLFLAGGQLALGSCDFPREKPGRFTTLAVAAAAVWNVGAAFVLGALLHWGFRRGLFRL